MDPVIDGIFDEQCDTRRHTRGYGRSLRTDHAPPERTDERLCPRFVRLELVESNPI
ncbi:MAG: hypothetical protein VX589_15380 [Myxococcota bacterium]|nr:hypothetical protein [Myxococcota bacterium]